MKYMGNYKDWIKEDWIYYLLNNDGTPRPKKSEDNPDSEEFTKASKVGYDLSQTYWQHYCNTSCPLIIEPPIIIKNKKVMWWFIKMLPGNFMPMHRDPHVKDDNKINCKRYWMPLQDYEPGHIFIYNTEFMCNYQAGDLWEYDDANEIHGACNIGYSPRLTFQFTSYDSQN